MKADIKSSQPEVKASKSVKRFQRYRQLKFGIFLPKFFELPGASPPGPPFKCPVYTQMMAYGHSSMNFLTCNVHGR